MIYDSPIKILFHRILLLNSRGDSPSDVCYKVHTPAAIAYCVLHSRFARLIDVHSYADFDYRATD